jgi:hypothetical protein
VLVGGEDGHETLGKADGRWDGRLDGRHEWCMKRWKGGEFRILGGWIGGGGRGRARG